MSEITVLGIFVADISFSGPKIPSTGETILGITEEHITKLCVLIRIRLSPGDVSIRSPEALSRVAERFLGTKGPQLFEQAKNCR